MLHFSYTTISLVTIGGTFFTATVLTRRPICLRPVHIEKNCMIKVASVSRCNGLESRSHVHTHTHACTPTITRVCPRGRALRQVNYARFNLNINLKHNGRSWSNKYWNKE